MKKLYGFMLAVFGMGFGFNAQAQDAVQEADRDSARMDKEFANPSVVGTPRSRFLTFKYERHFNYKFNSSGTNELAVGRQNATIQHSNIAEVKGFLPLWNRPHLKMILGIGYEREEFNFKDGEGYNGDFALHRNLQDKGLKSLSAQLAILRPINYENFWILRVKGQLNGDYTSDDSDFQDYLRTTAEAVYGWKKSKNFSWGLGVQLGYNFGRRSIFPALLYNRTFENENWGVESIFPANVNFRYRQSESSFFYAGYNLDGYSYVIKASKPPFQNSPAFAARNLDIVELRHNDIKFKLRWEREIYDFLWFSLEGGYRVNIAYDTFEEGTKRKVTLIETDAGSSPFAQAEVYFVVPRNFLKR